MSQFELRPVGGRPQHEDFTHLVWGSPSQPTDSVRASVDPWLSSLGPASPAAIDLVRLAAAAYMVDRQVPRRVGYTRTLRLHVQVMDADKVAAVIDQVASLLHWLSADLWEISISSDGLARPDSAVAPEEHTDNVALLSGGLDSLAGAIAGPYESQRIFVGHWDNPTIKASQDRVWSWLQDVPGVEAEYRQIHLAEAATKREASTRSRCLLFFALASAVASARGSRSVDVPENGFTSLNLSLGNNRGGVLSTRSTHPWTIFLVQQLLDTLGVEVRLENPYEQMTKGELVSIAGKSASLVEGVPLTLSCGKMDGRLYRGGNPNYNCGLCVACLTRRGSLLAAGLEDKTHYLMNTIDADQLPLLYERRAADLRAVRTTVGKDLEEFALLAQGPYPDTYDLSAAVELYHRGIAEMERALPQ